MSPTQKHLPTGLLAFILTMTLFPCELLADQEGRMPLTHVQFDSKGLDNSGPIHVDAVQAEAGLTELSVAAFGKRYVLTADQIATLNRREFNSIGLTYSRGYPETGGRNVVLLLCQGYSSGVKVIATVTIAESGDIRVSSGR